VKSVTKFLAALYLAGVVCVVGIIITGTASNEAAVAPTSAAEAFVRQSALNGMSQIELGEAVGRQAVNGEVRQLAMQIVENQLPLQSDLGQLAAERGIAMPAQRESDVLVVAGSDRELLDRIIALHERALEICNGEVSRGLDPDLRVYAWATATLVEHRLEQARSLRETLGETLRSSPDAPAARA
jgi:predicted outer membrane protein